MEVRGISSAQYPLPASRAASSKPTAEAGRPAPVEDTVELTAPEHLREAAAGSGDLKAARLTQIRAAIQAGTYETNEKFEMALERMLDKIGFQDD